MSGLVITGLPSVPWYSPIERPEWWLVIIGLFTLIIVAYQANKTAKATEAMRVSVHLQEIGRRQWVNLEKWECWFGEKQQDLLIVTFRIVNPTDVPLRLDGVLVNVEGDTGSDRGKGVASLLAPQNPYIMSFDCRLGEKQGPSHGNSIYQVSFEVSVLFTDALERKWQQIFGRRLVCESCEAEGMPGYFVANLIEAAETRNQLQSSEPMQ
jgi:hypothetical protein